MKVALTTVSSSESSVNLDAPGFRPVLVSAPCAPVAALRPGPADFPVAQVGSPLS